MEKEECTNEWCDDGVTSISYGEKMFCGICEGTGFINTKIEEDQWLEICKKIVFDAISEGKHVTETIKELIIKYQLKKK